MKKNSSIGLVAVVFFGMALLSGRADLRPFSDYQVILDRKPFGAPPDPSSLPAKIIPVSESFAASMALIGLFEEGESVRASILDRKDSSYFSIRVGETWNGGGDSGIELIDVDYEKEEAVLRKGDETVVLTMRDGEQAQVLSPEAVKEREKQAVQRRLSYAERRKARQAARAKPPVIPKPTKTGAELEEHLQNYQMEVLRQGLPPLPVQLTPDRDAQMVAEGLLPPVDAEGFEIDVDSMNDEEYDAYMNGTYLDY